MPDHQDGSVSCWGWCRGQHNKGSLHGIPRPLHSSFEGRSPGSWSWPVRLPGGSSPSGMMTGDQHTVAGTAMALGSHFSPVPYSLIKAWGFAPQPPSTLHDIGLILRHPVNQLRHAMVRCRHTSNAVPTVARLRTACFASRLFTMDAIIPTCQIRTTFQNWPALRV